MRLKNFLLIILFSATQVFSQQNTDSNASKKNFTEIDSEGKIQQRYLFEEDSRKEQEEDLAFLDQQIKDLQKELQRLSPYIKKFKADSVKDSKYLRHTEAYKQLYPDSKYEYIVNEFFSLNLENGSATFTVRRGRLGATKLENTQIRELSMEGDYKTIQLKVDRYHADGKQASEIYSFSSVVEPESRVKLVRNYRNELEKAVRTLDRIIEKDQNKQHVNTVNAVRDVDIN